MTEFQGSSTLQVEPYAFASRTASQANGVLAKAGGVGLLAIACFAAISLLTWSANDPSLMHMSTAKPTNALGALGAIFSDLILTSLGLAGILALLPPLYWAMRLLSGGAVSHFKLRLVLAPVALLLLAASLAAMPRMSLWPVASGQGGLLGELVLGVVSSLIALINQERAGLAAALICLVTGLGSLSVALGLTGAEMMALARRSKALHMPDSSWVAHLKQATGGGVPMPLSVGPESALDQRSHVTPPSLSLRPETASGWTEHHGVHNHAYGDAPARHVPLQPAVSQAANTQAAKPLSIFELQQALAAFEAPTANAASVILPVAAGPSMHATDDSGLQVALPAPVRVAPATIAVPPPKFYRCPPTTLLPKTSKQRASSMEMSLAEKLRGDRLRDVLAEFAVPGDIRDYLTGPVVTTFVFEPKAGTKTQRVLGMTDEIAKAMGVPSIRVQRNMGRASLVIEVPHEDSIAIGIRDLIEHDGFTDTALRLPLALGATAQGDPVIADLAEMPSLLITGRHQDERAGLLRATIAALVYRHRPDTLALALADGSGVLAPFAALPHCGGHAPARSVHEAEALLALAVDEIDARTLRLRSLAQSRTIEAYNSRVMQMPGPGSATVMPYYVIVIDELASLLAASAPSLETVWHRIVRDGPSVGLHLIAASACLDEVNVPDAVRNAFATRLTCVVGSRADSRDVLGEPGAEDLLGHGDALAMTSRDDVRRAFGGGEISRVHTTRISLAEATAVTAAAQPVYQSHAAVASTAAANHQPAASQAQASAVDDALYDRAVALVRREQAADPSRLRHALSVSYGDALSLIEQMTRDGIVSPADYDGHRSVLVGRAA